MLQGLLTSREELARIRSAIKQRRPVRAELRNYAKNGREYWVELDIVPLVNEQGAVHRFVSVQRDITARRELEVERHVLERQLQDAQRIESIGTLAGGIAHDFNNILPAILGNAELARDALPADHPARSSLGQIKKAALRGNGGQVLNPTEPPIAGARTSVMAVAGQNIATALLADGAWPPATRCWFRRPPLPSLPPSTFFARSCARRRSPSARSMAPVEFRCVLAFFHL